MKQIYTYICANCGFEFLSHLPYANSVNKFCTYSCLLEFEEKQKKEQNGKRN